MMSMSFDCVWADVEPSTYGFDAVRIQTSTDVPSTPCISICSDRISLLRIANAIIDHYIGVDHDAEVAAAKRPRPRNEVHPTPSDPDVNIVGTVEGVTNG